MGIDEEQNLRRIFPGQGGFNDEANPLLIGDAQSPDIENVDFDRRSLRGSLGTRKLHRDIPRLAAMRCCPRPIRRVAAQANAAEAPFAIIPFNPEQLGTKETPPDLQIDISFVFYGEDLDDTLTGEDQTEVAASVDDAGLIDAPPGGEFQFWPMVQKGGSDLEELTWILGIGIVQPEGFKDNAGNPTANVQPNKIRPIFAYWDNTLARLRFCVADTTLVPNMEYHLTLKLANNAANSEWRLNGYPVNQIAAGSGASDLPGVNDLDYSYNNAYYLRRGMFRDTGKYPDAPMFRGVYGINVAAGSPTFLNDASLVVPGDEATSYIDGYVRCLTSVNSALNQGCIRRITSHINGTGRIDFDAFPASLVGETVDVVFPMETTPIDGVIQEFRIWDGIQEDATVTALLGRQALKRAEDAEETLPPDPDKAYLVHAGTSLRELRGYWPLSDDGGSDLQDRSPIGNDGWFCSSPIGSGRGLHLDGERLALQDDLSRELRGHGALRHALGGQSKYNIHGRITLQLCRDIVDIDPEGQAVEEGLYETIFDWDDPAGESADPILSLRWTRYAGSRQFYFVWNSGTQSYVMPVDPTYIQPEIGRKVTLLFGLQNKSDAEDHRFYLLSTRGDVARGWSGTVNTVLGSLPELASPAAPGKTRISFGASVVGEEALGAGLCNACLAYVWDAGWSLRPMIGHIPVGGGLTLFNPPVDRWTSLDEPLSPHDVAPPISRDAETLSFTHGSRSVTPTSGGNLTNELNNFPDRYCLWIPGSKQRWLEEDRSPVERPRLVHVGDVPSTSALTLADPWGETSQAAMEARVAAYMAYSDLRIADAQEVSLNPFPPAGERWALQEVFEDLGVLGLQDRRYLHLALLPSVEGIPQSLYTPMWGDGLVIGWEKSRGLSQLKRSDGLRKWVQAVNGSLYNVRPRWVRDHPFLGRSEKTEWCLEFPLLPEARTTEFEANQPEVVRLDRRTGVRFEEGIRIEDNLTGASPFRLWIPNDTPGTETVWYILRAWIKMPTLHGRRTLSSRVGLASQGGPPELLVHDVNHHWYVEDGALVFRMANGVTGTDWTIVMGEDTPGILAGRESRAREYLREGEWIHVAVQIGVNGAAHAVSPDTFEGGNFFVNGRFVFGTILDGGLVPTAIPAPAGVTSGWVGVYGNSDPGSTGPWTQQRMIPFRWGLGGRISGFEAEQSDTEIEDTGNPPVDETQP